MKQGQTIILATVAALLLAPPFAYSQPMGAGAPIYRRALNMYPPDLKPGGPRPTLTAYAIDASGKPDEKIQHAPRVTCPDKCVFYAPPGTRVEVASNLPVRAWTGDCEKSNPSPEPKRKCIVTLSKSTGMGGPTHTVGAVLE